MKRSFRRKLWNTLRAPIRKKTYFNLLAKFSDFSFVQKNKEKLNNFFLSKKGRKAVDEVSQYIRTIDNNVSENIVYFFQHIFFDEKGVNYASGGAERYMLDLFKILSNMGYTPLLIQRGFASEHPWYKEKDGMKVIGLNVSHRDFLPALSALPEPKLAIYSCHVDWYFYTYKNSILLSHGITWDDVSVDVSSRTQYDLLKVFKTMVSVDTNVLSWFRTTFSASLDEAPIDLHCIPNYVDTSLFMPKPRENDGKIKILFPRRCVPNRGFWLLANNVSHILKTYPNTEIHFVGYANDTDIVEEIKNLLVKYPSQVFHYMKDADQMYQVYQEMDITLVPTLYAEGTSLSCLEAMACGNVVISTNIGGLPNLIFNGYNGLLINPNQSEMLEALDKVLADQELRIKLSQNAIAVAQAFNKDIWTKRWVDLLTMQLK